MCCIQSRRLLKTRSSIIAFSHAVCKAEGFRYQELILFAHTKNEAEAIDIHIKNCCFSHMLHTKPEAFSVKDCCFVRMLQTIKPKALMPKPVDFRTCCMLQKAVRLLGDMNRPSDLFYYIKNEAARLLSISKDLTALLCLHKIKLPML